MRVPWRRFGSLVALALVASPAACASSSAGTTEPSPTLLTVTPSTFDGNVVCGDFPGAWKTYVATLIDVTDEENPFVLASSPPVPCTMPVAFGWVVPGHRYVAEIDGYDRSGLQPFGFPSSGNRQMVDSDTQEPVEPQWRTQCGKPPADAGTPDGGELEASFEPTTAQLQTNVVVRDCAEFAAAGTGETALLLDLATVRGSLACGTDPGQIARLRVIPESPALEAIEPKCDAAFPIDVEPDQTYGFRVEAFEAGAPMPRWAARCEGRSEPGVTLPASCNTLSERGGLRIDVDDLLEAAGAECGEQVVHYRVALLGKGLSSGIVSCSADASFNGLEPAAYQAAADGLDASGATVFSAWCTGAVKPATTTTMSCQVSTD